jgi:hypothetical protein
MYASTAYAPPNVTMAAFEKNTAWSPITCGVPGASDTRTSGTIHTATPITRTRMLLATVGRV